MGRRAAILATALASVVVFASTVEAASDPVLAVPAAEAAVRAAESVRVTAEQRVAELDGQQAAIRQQIARASTETGAITDQIAAAREEARTRAVGAYVNGGTATELTVFLRSEQIDDAAARTAVLSSQTHSAVEAAAEFQKLKEENDPRVVAFAERLHTVSRELTDARSDLLQAEALQADAERALTAARAHEQEVATARFTTRGAAKARGGATAGSLSADDSEAEAWAKVRDCESGGDYRIVSASGRYRGAYQFDQRTWDSVAVTVMPDYVGVDPADAPPSVQDGMAHALYEQRGSRPWPHCGRYLP